MLRRISGEVKTTVAEAQTGVLRRLLARSLRERDGLTRPPPLTLCFAVAGRAKTPVPTLTLPERRQIGLGLVLASGRLVPGTACGRLRFFYVRGNLSACCFQHVVFLAVMVDL
jgi:hypothetical protein